MAAGSIVVELLMKTGSFETDTDRARKSLKKLKDDADKIGRAIGIGLVAAAGGLAYLVKSTIDANDHLNDLAQKTGIAADTLGGIGFAAQKAGGDLDTAALAAGKLNKSLAEAAAGDKGAIEAFDKLGVKFLDLQGNTRKADEALADIADQFEAMEDGPEKVAFALKLFGKAGADMIPLLNGGGAALRQQIAYFKQYSGVTADTARDADKFNDTLTDLKLLSGAFGKELTAQLLPAMQGLADLFLEAKEKGDGMKGVASDVADILKTLAFSAIAAGQGFLAFGKAIGGTLSAIDAAKSGNFQEAFAIGKETLADLGVAKDRIGAVYDAIFSGQKKVEDFSKIDFGKGNGWDPLKKGKRLTGDDKDKKAPDDFDRLRKQALELTASAQLRLEAEGKLTAAQETAAKVNADYLAGLLKLTPAQKAQIDALLATADATEKAADAKERDLRWIQDATDANANYVESLMQTRTSLEEMAKAAKIELEAFGLTRAEVDNLATARMRDAAAALEQKAAIAEADGFLDDVAKLYRQQAKAIRDAAKARDELTQKEKDLHYDGLVGATQAVKDYLDTLNRAGDDSYRFLTGTFHALEDGITEALTSGNYKDAAKKMVDGIISEFIRLSLVKPLLNSIFSGTQSSSTGAIAGIAGALSGLFGGANTTDYRGTTLPNTLRGGADGGSNLIERDMVTLLHKGEAVVPKAYNPAAGGKGGGNVYITNNGSGRVSAEKDQNGDWRVLVEAAAEAAHNRVNASIASGGSTHKVMAGQYGLSRASGAPKRA